MWSISVGSPDLGYLGGRFDIFFFSRSGRGKGESEARGGGVGDWFFIESPRGGGFEEGEGPGACLRRIGDFQGWGGGGLNIFFRGRNVHQGILKDFGGDCWGLSCGSRT